jgi:hypothetical protein
MTDAQRRQKIECRIDVQRAFKDRPLAMVLDEIIEELAHTPADQIHLVEAAGNKLGLLAHNLHPARRRMLDELRKMEGAL